MQTSVLDRWVACAERVRGSAHTRQDKQCQDDSFLSDESPEMMILAIADGHGSERSPKSHLGAEIAVRAAVYQLRSFATALRDQPLETVQTYAQNEIPRLLVREWERRVKAKVEKEKRTYEPVMLLEYGSTILAVLVTQHYILSLQLGDGDILRVAANGTVTRWFPPNPAHFANQTTSLAQVDKRTHQANGWLEMRVSVEEIREEPESVPSLIVVATDGYANSFRTDADFLRVGPDLLNAIRTDGWSQVKRSLRGWLEDATEAGSGDDITLGIICHTKELRR